MSHALATAVEEAAAMGSEARLGYPPTATRDAAGRPPHDPKRLIDGLMRLHESERSRVSNLLAAEVVPVVTMARYLIEDALRRLARGEVEDTSESLQNAAARMRDATDQMLALSQQLRPRAMDDLGLLAALAGSFRDFARENRAIFVSPRIAVTESEIPTELKLPILRIVQAALANVARHSRASAARVLLSMFEGELRLSIEDNGVGFDVERWRHRRNGQDGCGLAIACRWVETSGGQCSIEAIPRHGARVQAFWRIGLIASTAATPVKAEAGAAVG